MAKTTEHIGKIAHMVGMLGEFLGNCSNSDMEEAGLSPYGFIQRVSPDGKHHNFFIIAGECDPERFTEIITKEEANALIRSWFTPEYEVFHHEYFDRYLDMHLTAAHLDHISTLENTSDIYAYLVSEGFKFIKMSEFDGPQFDI